MQGLKYTIFYLIVHILEHTLFYAIPFILGWDEIYPRDTLGPMMFRTLFSFYIFFNITIILLVKTACNNLKINGFTTTVLLAIAGRIGLFLLVIGQIRLTQKNIVFIITYSIIGFCLGFFVYFLRREKNMAEGSSH